MAQANRKTSSSSQARAQQSCLVDLELLKERFLQCPVCTETCQLGERAPKLLPCNHTVCKRCLLQLLKHSPKNPDTASPTEAHKRLLCPTCRAVEFFTKDDISKLPNDHRMVQMLDFISEASAASSRQSAHQDSTSVQQTEGQLMEERQSAGQATNYSQRQEDHLQDMLLASQLGYHEDQLKQDNRQSAGQATNYSQSEDDDLQDMLLALQLRDYEEDQLQDSDMLLALQLSDYENQLMNDRQLAQELNDKEDQMMQDRALVEQMMLPQLLQRHRTSSRSSKDQLPGRFF